MPKGRLTSFDIAHLAGVSQPTVSRALRGSASVSEPTRKRIEAIARQHDYMVDRHASSLRTQRSDTLALLFFEDPAPDDSQINPFFLSMLGGITRAAAARGQDVLVSFQQAANWHAAWADSRKADGIILLGYGDYIAFAPKLVRLEEQGTRYVRWGLPAADRLGVTIGCDNAAGGHMAAAHLLALGRRRIAFLGTADSHYPEFEARHAGYVAALASAGIVADPALAVPALSSEAYGRQATHRLMQRGLPFDAVFAASDLIALGAMHALADAGRAVPGDVAVVGFDDIAAAVLATPALTTVAQDAGGAGVALVGALLDRIDGRPAADRLLPARLVVRRSCGG